MILVHHKYSTNTNNAGIYITKYNNPDLFYMHTNNTNSTELIYVHITLLESKDNGYQEYDLIGMIQIKVGNTLIPN